MNFEQERLFFRGPSEYIPEKYVFKRKINRVTSRALRCNSAVTACIATVEIAHGFETFTHVRFRFKHMPGSLSVTHRNYVIICYSALLGSDDRAPPKSAKMGVIEPAPCMCVLPIILDDKIYFSNLSLPFLFFQYWCNSRNNNWRIACCDFDFGVRFSIQKASRMVLCSFYSLYFVLRVFRCSERWQL